MSEKVESFFGFPSHGTGVNHKTVCGDIRCGFRRSVFNEVENLPGSTKFLSVDTGFDQGGIDDLYHASQQIGISKKLNAEH